MIDDNQILQKDFEDIKHNFVMAGLISTKSKLSCVTLKIQHSYSLTKVIAINIVLCLNQGTDRPYYWVYAVCLFRLIL